MRDPEEAAANDRESGDQLRRDQRQHARPHAAHLWPTRPGPQHNPLAHQTARRGQNPVGFEQTQAGRAGEQGEEAGVGRECQGQGEIYSIQFCQFYLFFFYYHFILFLCH